MTKADQRRHAEQDENPFPVTDAAMSGYGTDDSFDMTACTPGAATAMTAAGIKNRTIIARNDRRRLRP